MSFRPSVLTRAVCTPAARGMCAGFSGSLNPLTLLPGIVSAWWTPEYGVYQETTGASATTPAAADSDPVGTWAARTSDGSLIYAVAAGAGNRPLYKTAMQNGKAAALFDGTNDALAVTLGAEISQPNTLFVVGRYTSASGRIMIDGVAAAKRHYIGLHLSANDITVGSSAAGFQMATTTDNTFQLLVVQYNGVSSKGWKNGGTSSSGTGGADALAGVTLGARYNLAAPLQGYIGEVILARGALSDTQVDSVRSYLNTRWAVY